MTRLLSIVLALALGISAAAQFVPGSPVFHGLLNRSAVPVDPVLSFSPAPSSWLAMTNLAAPATDVDYIPDRTGNWLAAVATNSFQPQATNAGVYWDGSTDLLQLINWSFPTEVIGGVTNATTGLCYDPRDDTLWRADFVTGELIHMNQAGREIARISTSIGVTNVQGLALVPTTGNFWVADVVDDILYQVDAAGATIYSTNILAYSPNGVAYDPTLGRLHVLAATTGVIHSYNESDMSYIGFISPTTTAPDGIWIGTNGHFFVSQDGFAFGSSAVLEIDPATGSTLNTYSLPWIDNIEHGCQLPNGRIYIGVDDDWHNTGTQVDYVARLTPAFTPADIGRDTSGVTITALIKPAATPTSARFIAFLSDASAANNVRQGAALGLTSGKMSAAGRKNDGGSSALVTTTSDISTSEYTLLSAVLDYANATASVYTNGVLAAQNTSFFTAGTSTNSIALLSNIGAGRNAAYFHGEMVHLFLWNQALDASQQAAFKAIIMPP